MEDILKIIKSFEDSGLLPEGATKTIQNEAKEQRGRFLSMLLGTLGASLLGDMLLGKGVIRAGEGTAKVGYGTKRSSIKKSSLKNFDPTTSAYYQNEPRFNGVYSRDNLSEHSSRETIKNRAYIINLDEYPDTGTH